MIDIEEFLQEVMSKNFFSSHHKILIAVSGGVDSMNLLHFLYVSRETLNIAIGIAHVNHHQRPESQQEESFLKQWGTDHHVPVHVSHFTGEFSEKSARDFRYRFFEKVMRQEGYTALVTAHHADDQVETILMRFIRGSKLRFQSGINEKQPFGPGELIRPLLSFSKDDLPSPFHFEDKTNKELKYFRNRIRQSYLPLLYQENPKLNLAILRHGQEVTNLIQALKDLTQTLEKQNCHVFQQQTPAVQTFLLEDYLDQFPDLQLNHKTVNLLLKQLNHQKDYDYPLKNGYYFKKSKDHFEVTKIGPQTDANPFSLLIECGQSITLRQYQITYSGQDTLDLPIIPLKTLSPVVVRHRKPGDRILIRGISKKLRRFFIDEKIPDKSRQETLIFEQDNQVIAVLCEDKTYLSNPCYHDIMKAKLYIQKL